jgi:putative nucleotidyltransferase with HDIG domain
MAPVIQNKPTKSWETYQLPIDPQGEARGLTAIGIATLKGAARDLSFDVFLKVSSDNFVHVFSSATGLDYQRLSQYETRGVLALYVRKSDFDAYKRHVAKTADQLLSDVNLPDERRIALIINLTEQALADAFAQVRVVDTTATEVKQVIRRYVDLMLSSPRSLALMLKLVAHGDYLYYHSIAVSVFALLLARASGQLHTEDLEMVGLGGFLHDIGHLDTPKEILEAPRSLTSEETEIVRKHVDAGMDRIRDSTELPREVAHIIYQHHEQPDGNGYPNQLKDKAMSHPARFVQIADCFSALISTRPWRKAYSVPQAIRILLDEGEKHDRKLVALLSNLSIGQAIPPGQPPVPKPQ